MCRFSLNLVFLALLFTGFSTLGNSQDTTKISSLQTIDLPHVIWIKQWPSPDKKRESHTFKARFNSIFLGKKPLVLSKPVSVLAFNPDDFWILDQGAGSVFHVQGDMGDIPHYIRKSDFELSSLVGMCSASTAGILFTDSGAKKVFRISPDKKKIEILNDSLTLDQPTGIAWSAVTNEIWVVETNAHRITVLNEKGEIVKRIGSRGASKGEFNYPTHIWIDKTGMVYIVDAMNFRIQVFEPFGEVVSVFGQQGDASGYFARPKGIATDSHGNIYIADALFHVVQVFDLKGNFLYKFGAQGRGAGEFWMPSGIYIDNNDFIYVADCYNSRIQVFQLVYGNKK
ncbi:MAG: 6-bladed beta-propeller [Bacteroidetes bacterium]|nr:6-bladed beta-propeller [Bacteroidota bacterium]